MNEPSTASRAKWTAVATCFALTPVAVGGDRALFDRSHTTLLGWALAKVALPVALALASRSRLGGVVRASARVHAMGSMTLTESLTVYFDGEKSAGVVLAVIGALALAWGGLIVRRGAGDLRGVLWPVMLVGALQLAVGVGLYARTDAQVASLRTQLDREPAAFFTAERARMEKVQRNFVVIEWVEVALLVVGIALALGLKGSVVAWGVGAGMVVQAGVMLAFDLLAERRGAAWLDAIRRATGG